MGDISSSAPTKNDGGEPVTLEDDLATCVGCGLCLPHCPTFRVTGEEGHSPRGRISLIRSGLDRGDSSAPEARVFLDTCVQCRGCEPACPSGVEYGRILAAVNRRDELAGRLPPISLRIFLSVLRHPALLRVVARLGLLVNSLPGARFVTPRRLQLRGLPFRQGRRLRRRVDDPTVWIFMGCVMDSWFRRVHTATLSILEASGAVVSTPTGDECCGALHLHAGRESVGLHLASRVMDSMPGSAPIVVDSAGCGAMLKEYGELLGTEEAHRFSDRVLDIHEWIDQHCRVLIPQLLPIDAKIESKRMLIVQEPCHLRHVQRVSMIDVLERFAAVERIDDDGLCCGAGGTYSLVQSDMSRAVRARKVEGIHTLSKGRESTIVTSNPGCHLHLAAEGFDVISSSEVIAEALGLLDSRNRRKS